MFDKFTYLFYTLIFTIPFILFLWAYYFKVLKKNFIIILLTTVILTFYGFFLWPAGLTWKTWEYNNQKILGLTIFGTVFEDIVWWFLISFLISSCTIIIMKKEDQKENLFNIKNLLKKEK